MKNPNVVRTTAENLEAKFDRGDDVLDYFDTKESLTLMPVEHRPVPTSKESVHQTTVMREEPAEYTPTHVTGSRTLSKPNGDARYICRDAQGRIQETNGVGRSLKEDREVKVKATARPRHSCKGNQKKP